MALDEFAWSSVNDDSRYPAATRYRREPLCARELLTIDNFDIYTLAAFYEVFEL